MSPITTTPRKTRTDRQWLVKLLQKYHHHHDGQHQNKDPLLRNKALVVAPMVEQSDLPFRLLCRKYGANLAFTPMIHAGYFTRKYAYRTKMWMWTQNNSNSNDDNNNNNNPCAPLQQDRPLIAQLCGNHKDILLKAALTLQQAGVDAIDINCGCPTQTAKRGGWGAYLLQSGDHVVNIIQHLVQHLTCPVTIKVRLLPTGNVQDSIDLYQRFIDAGVSMITIHGRTKDQKGLQTGQADWKAIQTVVQQLGSRIPILANGNIATLDDVRDCIRQTGCDGIMSSESILEYPPLYTETQTQSVNYKRTGPGRLDIAYEYLDLCTIHPPQNGGGGSGMQCMRMHLDAFLHAEWHKCPQLREKLRCCRTTESIQQLYDVLDEIRTIHTQTNHKVQNEQLSWYMRHRHASNSPNSTEDDTKADDI